MDPALAAAVGTAAADPAAAATTVAAGVAAAPAAPAPAPQHDPASTWGFGSFEHAVEATFKELAEKGERHTRDQVAEFLKMLHALGQALRVKQAGAAS